MGGGGWVYVGGGGWVGGWVVGPSPGETEMRPTWWCAIM